MADFSNSTVVPIRPAQVHLQALTHRPTHAELFDRLVIKAIAARTEHELVLAQLHQGGSVDTVLPDLKTAFELRFKAVKVLAAAPSLSASNLRRKRFAIGNAWLQSRSTTFQLIQDLLEDEAEQFATADAQRRA